MRVFKEVTRRLPREVESPLANRSYACRTHPVTPHLIAAPAVCFQTRIERFDVAARPPEVVLNASDYTEGDCAHVHRCIVQNINIDEHLA